MPFEGKWVKQPAEPTSSSGDGANAERESFEIQYTAKEAGDFELHVWCDPDGSGVRQWLTGSPFAVRVTGVRPSAEGSFVERLGPDELSAGEAITIKPQLRDQFGNASAARDGSFKVFIDAPDGQHFPEMTQLKGLGLYQVTYDVTVKGQYLVHFVLNGEDISGSPVEYFVLPGLATGAKSRLFAPPEPPVINLPCTLLLEAIDKFGNKLDRGGSRVDARANGPGVSSCAAEDRADGTYNITFTAAVVGETRVTVRLDNVEMAPLKLVFVEGGSGAAKGKGSKNKSELVMAPASAPASVEDSEVSEVSPDPAPKGGEGGGAQGKKKVTEQRISSGEHNE